MAPQEREDEKDGAVTEFFIIERGAMHDHVTIDEDMMHAYQEIEQAARDLLERLGRGAGSASLRLALEHVDRARAFNDAQPADHIAPPSPPIFRGSGDEQ